MALDTYGSLWRKVLLRCPLAGQSLARDWITNAFRRVAERKAWSWLIKQNQILTVDAYSTGTAVVTHNSATVTGTDTVWTSAMVGRQFKVGNNVYTISTFTGATEIALDDEYGGDTDATASYSIYQTYVEMPTDFHAFISIWDPERGRSLNPYLTQHELNSRDPQRSNQGDAWGLAFLDYKVPSGGTVSVPRYEIWPHQVAQHRYAYLYESRPTDLQDSGATLPRFLHGDLLMEMALEQAASWPGPSADNPNPYYDMQLAKYHGARAEQMIMEMERQDEEVYLQGVQYVGPNEGGYYDADWLQKHAL